MKLYLVLLFLGGSAYAMDEAEYAKQHQDLPRAEHNKVHQEANVSTIQLKMQLHQLSTEYKKLQKQVKDDKRAEYELKRAIKLYLFCTGLCVTTFIVALSTLICSIRS